MKYFRLLLPLTSVLASLAHVNAASASDEVRGDALYYQNSEGGRKAAHEVKEVYHFKREVLLVDYPIPALQPPSAKLRSLPIYPSELKKAGIDGQAVITFIVDENGNVSEAAVVSSTRPEFGEAAMVAIKTWKFQPAKRGGKAACVLLRVPIGFDHSKAGK